MVLLLTDVFLLLTQIFLWLIVGTVIWYFLKKFLSQKFLGTLVLLLLLAVIVLAFFRGGFDDGTGLFVIIWRLIAFLLTPLGLALIFLTVLLKKPKGVVEILLFIGLLIIAMGTIPVVSYFLVQELEMEAIELINPVPQLENGGRQVIVLLGQDTTRLQLRPRVNEPPRDDKPVERAITENQFQVLSQLPTQLTEQGDRILYAAQLYQEETQRGTTPLIVVSAGSRGDRRRKEGEVREDITEAKDIQRMLSQSPYNIPEGNILLDHDNGNIRSSAEKVRELLQKQQINYGNQIILVGSALNMNRAALTFREVFRESRIIARPTDFFTIPERARLERVATGRDLIEREIQITDIIPTAQAFYWSSEAIREYLNALYYFLRGWIRPFQAPNLTRPVAAAGSLVQPTDSRLL